ncbi:MAG: pantoate--beta-alanine ligase [Neolewinella sp.]
MIHQLNHSHLAFLTYFAPASAPKKSCMKTISTAKELRDILDGISGTVAFVPTMGALHNGHMVLIEAAGENHDIVVASIFVNPTQFNESSDLDGYPRMPEADAEMLGNHGCHYLYLPSVADVYPHGAGHNPTAALDFGSLTSRMEGTSRPGHFDGVAQVVSRLLEIVQPNTLVMGQKDYQQAAVVRSMIRQMGTDFTLLVVPTVRETDGLAMSSRNRRLSHEDRLAAGTINLHLKAVVAGLRAGWSPRALEELAISALSSNPLLHPEYMEVCDGDTLQSYVPGTVAREIVIATAVRCGPVRLIDNHVVSL